MTAGRTPVLLDAAGGTIGGAARWHHELSGHLADVAPPVRVIGRGRRLTPSWLVRREWLARTGELVVAPNNASFAVSGAHRRVLAVNALHYLCPAEEHLLDRFPRRWRAQIPVIRRLLARADLVIAPSTAMAERVAYQVPAVRRRLTVRAHPVTAVGPRQPADRPFLLVPVMPGPYKNLFGQLRALTAAVDRLRHPASIQVTAARTDLPADLAADPRITALGVVPFEQLAGRWRAASAVFFPCTLEAFGFPLAEARSYGLPVIAPDTGHAREIAGAALRGYRPEDPASLVDALIAAGDPVAPDPVPFDRDAYFRWLFDPGDADATAGRAAVPAAGPAGEGQR